MSLGLYHSGQDGLLVYRNIHDASPYSSNLFSVVAITVGAFPPASSIREEAGRLTRASGKHSGLANGTVHCVLVAADHALSRPAWHGTRYHCSCEAGW